MGEPNGPETGQVRDDDVSKSAAPINVAHCPPHLNKLEPGRARRYGARVAHVQTRSTLGVSGSRHEEEYAGDMLKMAHACLDGFDANELAESL